MLATWMANTRPKVQNQLPSARVSIKLNMKHAHQRETKNTNRDQRKSRNPVRKIKY